MDLEQQISNLWVVGSNPTRGTKKKMQFFLKNEKKNSIFEIERQKSHTFFDILEIRIYRQQIA